MANDIEIYNARLNASLEEIRNFIDRELSSHRDELDVEFNIGRETFWEEKNSPKGEANVWRVISITDTGSPIGDHEHNSGRIELLPAFPQVETQTDVVIYCSWPVRKAWWEGIAEKLRSKFGEIYTARG